MPKPPPILDPDVDDRPTKALGADWPVGQWHFQSGIGYIPVNYDPVAKNAPGIWAVKEPDGTIFVKNILPSSAASDASRPSPDPPASQPSSEPSSQPSTEPASNPFMLTPPGDLQPPKPPGPSLDIPKLTPPSFSGPEGCFAAGTQVATPEGATAIDRIVAGDVVLCFDEQSRTFVEGLVTKRWDHDDLSCLRLVVTGGPDLIVTGAHRFLSAEGRWIAARELMPGDRLVRVEGTGDARVVASVPIGTSRVFNLSVAPHPTFLVEGLVVHNTKIEDPAKEDED